MYEKHLGHYFNVWGTFLNIVLMHGKHLGHYFNAWETFGTLFYCMGNIWDTALMYGKHF